MAEREPAALLGTSHFRVLIGREELGFSEVSPLSSEADPESGEQFAHVVLRRALTVDTTLFDWRRAIVDGKRDRRSVTIHQLEGAAGRIANSWRLVRAWPCRWSGPALNALESGIAFEEVELAFDDLVWLRPRQSRRSSRPTSQGVRAWPSSATAPTSSSTTSSTSATASPTARAPASRNAARSA